MPLQLVILNCCLTTRLRPLLTSCSIQQYRSPLDNLRLVDTDLADELQSAGSQLETFSTWNTRSPAGRFRSSPDAARATHRKLLVRWNELLARVRSLPGFKYFLDVLPYHELQHSAKGGPILILNASELRCDAIVVGSSGPPSLVPLSTVSSGMLKRFSEDIISCRFATQKQSRVILLQVLRSLWHCVVSPVTECLTSMGVNRYSRVWWCPCSLFTGIPIHAAGLYDGGPRSNFMDLYVSSYISTISALGRVQVSESNKMKSLPSLLFVGHPGGNLQHVGGKLTSVAAELLVFEKSRT